MVTFGLPARTPGSRESPGRQRSSQRVPLLRRCRRLPARGSPWFSRKVLRSLSPGPFFSIQRTSGASAGPAAGGCWPAAAEGCCSWDRDAGEFLIHSSISAATAITELLSFPAGRCTGNPCSRSQRWIVRSLRPTYWATSFHEFSNSLSYIFTSANRQ
jgi:hypothetical protein